MQTWKQANEWESNWWGDCLNTVVEEIKQKTYNRLMGLTPYEYDLKGKSVIDIGGGPVSLLLKYKNRGMSTVVDPLIVPDWVRSRYEENDIEFLNMKAEDFYTIETYDEAWFYNCLQHTDDPELIVKNARAVSKIVRVFEWVETGTADGHIHNLTEKKLNKWLGGEGKVESINENYCKGLCYFGVFKGENYEI